MVTVMEEICTIITTNIPIIILTIQATIQIMQEGQVLQVLQTSRATHQQGLITPIQIIPTRTILTQIIQVTRIMVDGGTVLPQDHLQAAVEAGPPLAIPAVPGEGK